MAHKLNIGIIRKCPSATALAVALGTWGRPTDNRYGIIELDGNSLSCVRATLTIDSDISIPQLRKDDGAIDTKVEVKTKLVPFAVWPDVGGTGIGRIETYAGAPGLKVFEKIEEFLKEAVEAEITIEGYKPDLISTIEAIRDETQTSRVASCRVSAWEHADIAKGPYTPKFEGDSGMEFIENDENLPLIKSVKLEVTLVQMPSQASEEGQPDDTKADGTDALAHRQTGKPKKLKVRKAKPKKFSITVTPYGCYSFTAKKDQHKNEISEILRKVTR